MILSITGSSGFVGTNFKKEYPGYTIQDIDLLITKPKDVDLSGSHTVLHLAALVHQMKGAPESEYFKINSDLAFAMARHAKESGVGQFIFMSTVKVYGEYTSAGNAWNENSPCYPIDPYGKSKLEGEQRVRELENQSFKIAVVRAPLVYGPGVKANMFHLMKLIEKYPFIPFGNIHNKRSLTYIGNLAQLIHEIIQQQKSGVFLASDEAPVSTTDLVKEIRDNISPKTKILPVPMLAQKLVQKLKPGIHQRLFGNLEVDNTLTRNSLQLSPKYSFQEGIAQMVKGEIEHE